MFKHLRCDFSLVSHGSHYIEPVGIHPATRQKRWMKNMNRDWKKNPTIQLFTQIGSLPTLPPHPTKRKCCQATTKTRWWFQISSIFTHIILGKMSNLTCAYFFKWVGSTTTYKNHPPHRGFTRYPAFEKKEFCISKCVTADACASINPEVPPSVAVGDSGWTWVI